MKRFTQGGSMHESQRGDWVTYDEHRRTVDVLADGVKSLMQGKTEISPALRHFLEFGDLPVTLSQPYNVKHEPRIRHHDTECICACGAPWPCSQSDAGAEHG
jgi:hypothetical protein